MKNTILYGLLVGVLGMAAMSCATASDHRCNTVNQITMHVDWYYLSMTPKRKEPFCIAQGGTIDMRIVVPGSSDYTLDAGDVIVHEKGKDPNDPAENLIYGVNGANNTSPKDLLIKIDASVPKGEDVQFAIRVNEVGMLDPRVRVVESLLFRDNRAYWQLVDALSVTLDIPVEDIEAALETIGDDGANAEH